jgi:hypothetical protein
MADYGSLEAYFWDAQFELPFVLGDVGAASWAAMRVADAASRRER